MINLVEITKDKLEVEMVVVCKGSLDKPYDRNHSYYCSYFLSSRTVYPTRHVWIWIPPVILVYQ